MKRLIFTLKLVLLTGFVSFAQTEQGSFVLAGSTNLNFISSDGTSQTEVDISGGTFVADNFVLGLGLGYERISNNGFSVDQTIIGILARYYAGGNVILGTSLSTVSNGGGEVFGLEIGYAHFFNEHVSIEPAFNYAKSLAEGGGSASGINIGFGVYF